MTICSVANDFTIARQTVVIRRDARADRTPARLSWYIPGVWKHLSGSYAVLRHHPPRAVYAAPDVRPGSGCGAVPRVPAAVRGADRAAARARGGDGPPDCRHDGGLRGDPRDLRQPGETRCDGAGGDGGRGAGGHGAVPPAG